MRGHTDSTQGRAKVLSRGNITITTGGVGEEAFAKGEGDKNPLQQNARVLKKEMA
jgi:hypothetical protein